MQVLNVDNNNVFINITFSEFKDKDAVSRAVEKAKDLKCLTGIPAVARGNNIILRIDSIQSPITLLADKLEFNKINSIKIASYGENIEGYSIGDDIVLGNAIANRMMDTIIYLEGNTRRGSYIKEMLESLDPSDVSAIRKEFGVKGIQIITYIIVNGLDIAYIKF
jgi:hypothetical protein